MRISCAASRFAENDTRPAWLVQINFSGLKLRLMATITVIAAVHLLGSFLEVGSQNDRDLLWQVVVVLSSRCWDCCSR